MLILQKVREIVHLELELLHRPLVVKGAELQL
jgi:hypothetical protein